MGHIGLNISFCWIWIPIVSSTCTDHKITRPHPHLCPLLAVPLAALCLAAWRGVVHGDCVWDVGYNIFGERNPWGSGPAEPL